MGFLKGKTVSTLRGSMRGDGGALWSSSSGVWLWGDDGGPGRSRGASLHPGTGKMDLN